MDSGFGRITEDVRSVAGSVDVNDPVSLLYREWIGGRWIDVEVVIRAVGRN